MNYFTNGQPDTSSGGVIPRGGRYTWAYLSHRSPPSSPGGLRGLAGAGTPGRATAIPSGKATFPASGLTQDTQVTITFAGQAPTIRRGTWILDTSYDNGSTLPNGVVTPPTFSVHGDFYRVVSVSPVPGNPNQLNLELQDPISKPSGISAVTVMDNVADVFKRGVGYANQWEFRNQNP